jgi:hypothetical protein
MADDLTVPEGLTFTVSNLKPTNRFLFQGDKGTVVIDMNTGTVTHEGYTPDEAAKVFWDYVEKYLRSKT